MEDPIDGLFTMLRTCGSSEGFKKLQNMRQDLIASQKELEKLDAAYNTNLGALAKKEAQLQAERSRHERDVAAEKERVIQAVESKERTDDKLKDEKQKLASKGAQLKEQEQRLQNLITQLKGKDNRIQTLENVEKERDRLSRELASTRQDLSTKTGEITNALDSLATVQSFVVRLEGLQPQRDRICEALGAMFNDAYSFLDESFGPDLDNSCLVDSTIWESPPKK
ncbi:uncharacterized protein HRG_06223 [Hirsutella rhossiliensis]|uniref:Uncharacterized protein n=1 Tax=Hirsutella rhossiliensis TaxID=111463 RepID=A0A9P8MWS3_9HYPO|nr:uncharacterized protein HRG_06223 [Hirsutella rhossiliensis]KAH0963713.1 hypothetical protein HRG_06223 [Hirsutella rhossiliensis]